MDGLDVFNFLSCSRPEERKKESEPILRDSTLPLFCLCLCFWLRNSQRRRDDAFEGGGPWGQRGKSSKNAVSLARGGERHDNKILQVEILLWKNVVIAQAPKFWRFQTCDSSGREKAHKQKYFWPVTVRWGGGVSRSGVQGSEPKEHQSFCLGTRTGRPVTEVTGQSFIRAKNVPKINFGFKTSVRFLGVRV